MSEPITPALTPEEWAPLKSEEDVTVAREFTRLDGGTLIVDGHYAGQDRHALAALALHGQPFGFTWADVDALRAEYEAVMDAQSDESWDADSVARAQQFAGLADRIAALLPPREP